MKIYFRDIIFAIIFIFVASIIYIIISSEKNINYSNVKIVDNSTNYYDVAGIVSKVIHLSNDDNVDKLLNVLEKNYIKENKINKNNVFKYMKKYNDDNISFASDKMYYEDINKRISKYYVHGFIESVSMDNYEIIDDYCAVVIIDKKNSTFAFIFDDGKIFKEVEQWILK